MKLENISIAKQALALHKEADRFDMLLDELNCAALFRTRWKHHFDEPLGCIFYKNLITEVRDALNNLLNYGSWVPTNDFDHLPSFSDFWDFVENNVINLYTNHLKRGYSKSFKTFVLEVGTFEEIMKDPQKRQTLEDNLGFHTLIQNYIPFSHLEIEHGDRDSVYQIQKSFYERLEAQKQEAIQQGTDAWIIDKYDERLNYIRATVDNAKAKVDETVLKMTQTPFFEMLKLWTLRNYILEHKSLLKESELVQLALQEALHF